MKIHTCIYIILFTGLFIGGCRNKKDIEEQRYTWYSDAPLTVPYRIRIQRFDKGNLIRNSSFETGRIYKLDSISASFVIDGWQLIGHHVEWVDIRNDSLFNSDEAFSGFRAMRIIREKAPETDEQGDGIISDFIKVIPGNYDLSLYARLENIIPQRRRLGIKMFDGVNIGLLFYDRNKIQIKPVANFPYASQSINNSFKALSFANFEQISSIPWSRVTGKSQYYPFNEGDIPSEAHFVRILISLKASGKLWVDSVDFHYSDKNFSVAERMQPFTDTAILETNFLIPQPKNVRNLQPITFLNDVNQSEELPVIVIEKNAGTLVREAAEIVRQQLQESLLKFGNSHKNEERIRIVDHLNVDQELHAKLIISIGKSELFLKKRSVLPEKKIAGYSQGYFIAALTDNPRLIFIGANDDLGVYYGALTINQMIDKKKPLLHCANVLDYPDFPQRFIAMPSDRNPQPGYISEMTGYKINGILMLNNGSKKGDTVIKDARFLMMQVDGYRRPDDTSLMYNNSVYFPDIKSCNSFICIPSVFNNDLLDNAGFPANQTSNSVDHFIYTGSSFFSTNTNAIDILRYTTCMGKNPVFMDNSMLMSTAWGQFNASSRFYPGKIRLFNLFEPYANDAISEYFTSFDTSMFIVNLPVSSEIEMIRVASAAEFMWNGAAYSKDFVLWKILCSRYGSATARLIILYAEKYSFLLEVLMKVEMKIQPAKNLKSSQQMMTELTGIVAEIAERTDPHNRLLTELHIINAGMRQRLNQSTALFPVKK